jgi:hypothetical protein
MAAKKIPVSFDKWFAQNYGKPPFRTDKEFVRELMVIQRAKRALEERERKVQGHRFWRALRSQAYQLWTQLGQPPLKRTWNP